MQVKNMKSRCGVPGGVPHVSRDDVCICTWNCRGLPRASFRANLFTLWTMTQSMVIVLADTRTCQSNAREVLDQAHGLSY